MEISGLPLHPLVVHAAVVLGPIAALMALAYVGVSRWREWLHWPLLVVALGATFSLLAAFFSGDSFLESNPALESKPLVETHEERAELLLWITFGFGALAVANHLLHPRVGTARTVVRVGLALAAVAVLVQVVLVGDAGARAVWEGV